MKLVKEHINEKFQEDSDPIQDLEIGFFRKRNFSDYSELSKFITDNLPIILGTKNIPEDIMFLTNEVYIKREYFNKILGFVKKYVRVKDIPASVGINLIEFITYQLKQLGFKKIRL